MAKYGSMHMFINKTDLTELYISCTNFESGYEENANILTAARYCVIVNSKCVQFKLTSLKMLLLDVTGVEVWLSTTKWLCLRTFQTLPTQ